MDYLIAWRRMRSRVSPPGVLTVRVHIDVEGPEWKKVAHKRLRTMSDSMNGRMKSRLAYSRLTWQWLENACIHVSLVLMVVYAAVIADALISRPELRYSITYFALEES